MFESRVLPEILKLDPVADHQRICYLSTCFDFPWNTTRSLEFALYRTYCVPRTTRLLQRAGEFTQRAQKRYDDTVLILAELLEHGYDSPRGRQAMRRMNQLHGRFPIANEDFLYTLSTFVFEPIRWNARFGWRPMTDHEKRASFHYWRAVGRRMNIKQIPERFGDFERFNVQYERTHFTHGRSNHVIGVATREVFANWFPRPTRPLVRLGIYALLEDPVLDALRLPRQPKWLTKTMVGALKLRGRALRYLPRRRKPRLITERHHTTYPHGYRIEELGPTNVPQPPAEEPAAVPQPA